MVNFRRVAPLKWQFVNGSDEIWDEGVLQWIFTPTAAHECAVFGVKSQLVPRACSFPSMTRIICEADASGEILHMIF